MGTKKQIEIIREKCKKLGLNVYDVFREAKVPVVTVSNWTRKEPDAFDTLRKINEAIEVCAETKRKEEERIKEVFRKNRRIDV